jgi:TIR domain
MKPEKERLRDAFVSHASEDKERFVRPLTGWLTQLAVDVWYDEYELKPGDSLRERIEDGLLRSRFGIVILSKHFFSKPWPRREYNALVALETANRGRIIPVWLDVTREDVLQYSPSLADVNAVLVQGRHDAPLHAAIKLIEVIRPDVFKQIEQHAERAELGKKLSLAASPIFNIPRSPLRHERLHGSLVDTIRVIWAAGYEHFGKSFQETIDDFRREMHPEDEVRQWEHIVAAYLLLLPRFARSFKRRHALFSALLSLSIGFDPLRVRRDFPQLSDRDFKTIVNVFPGPFSNEQWEEIRLAAAGKSFDVVFRIENEPPEDVISLNDGTQVIVVRRGP